MAADEDLIQRLATPPRPLPVDGDEIKTLTGSKIRFNTCMMGISSDLLEDMVERVAQRVVDKLRRLEVEEQDLPETEDIGGYVSQAALWTPPKRST